MKYLYIILIILPAILLHGGQVNSFFSDHKSFSIGDVITIIISEQSSAQTSAGSQTEKSYGHDLTLKQGQGFVDMIPLSSAGLSGKHASKGDANTSRSAKFQAKMTAKIIAIDSSDNLVIKGQRSVTINGEEEITSLEGVVRPQDVASDNSVYSYSIADAKISYKGKGDIHNSSKVGWLTKAFNWLF
ncbi:MAG: flagellar basal body L-ring protein FlgH [Candidatus Cloacimonetes bacterium]|nr:flagellar basal body L-ring protein FlgH [Candidatus Cloacimonadota bacterium]